MAQVNLLPPGILVARQRSRRLRFWATAVSVSVAISLVPMGFKIIQQARATELARKVENLSAKLKKTNAQLTADAQETVRLTKQLARADALRTKRPWSSLLATVAGALDEEAWLERIESVDTRPGAPSQARSSVASDTEDQVSVVRLAGPSGARLVGYAETHEGLYRIVAQLKETRAFERVEMAQAQREPVLAGDAVRFVIACSW